MTVAVLVVNWNAGALLGRCLAVARAADAGRPIASSSSTTRAATTRSTWRRRILASAEVIRLDENVGFARANNIAARAAGDVDALALLNPDAFPEPGWLAALVDAAGADLRGSPRSRAR